MLSPAPAASGLAAASVDAKSQNHDPGVSRTTNRSRAARHATFSPSLITQTRPGRDEHTSEQKRVLPESMTDASGRIHAPLTQKPDDKNHSGVTAEDEILPGRKDPSIF